MSITGNIKETMRKVTNKVVDDTEEMTGITKSPKELAKRMIEHLTHQEYSEVVHMLTVELNKYVKKAGLEDSALVHKKMENFEEVANSLAENLKEANYQKITDELEKLKNAIPDQSAQTYGVLGISKKILANIIDTLKSYEKEGTKPDFNNLTVVLEDSFAEFRDQ